MAPDELLARMAATLRTEIGPAIDGAYPRTQAFMGAVVLEKLSREVQLAAAHAAADERDGRAMLEELESLLAATAVPAPVRDALDATRTAPGPAAVSRLVESLYGGRSDLGEPVFAAALGRVRVALRASIDRRMEVAR